MKAGLLRAYPVALLGWACLLPGGCSESPAEPEESKPVVGILLYRDNDVYVSLVSAALQNVLGDRTEVIVRAAAGDQFTQNEQLETLLAGKVDALAVNLVDTASGSVVIDKVRKAGIPLVFFNREPDPHIVQSYDRACFVGTRPEDAGKLQGEIIKALWDKHPEYDRNADGKLQYIMLQANPSNPEAVARTEYSVRQARELGVPLQQVGETLMCDWDDQLALEAMRMILVTRKDVELVISNNDSMALGAIEALQEQGYNTIDGPRANFIPVIGVDATPQAVDAIAKGIMSATVKQDGERMGAVIAACILNAVAGQDFLEGMDLEWDETGVALRIPYAPYSLEED